MKIGLIIILVGVMPLLYTTYRTRSHNWSPLSVPVNLSRGEYQSPGFETDLTGTYIVSIAFDNGLAFDKEACMIGEELIKGSCGNAARTLFVGWGVAADGASLISTAQYEPHAFSSSLGRFETELGSFQAKRGNRQKIVLNVLSDAGELNTAHPRLTVRAHRIYWEEWIILGQLAFLCAIVVGGIGIGLIVLPLLFRPRKPQFST